MSISMQEATTRRKIFAEVLEECGTQSCALVTGSFRAGTSYICSQLAANGMPGLRGERFSNFWPLSRGGSSAEFREYCMKIFSSTKDQIFFSKIMLPHRNNFALSMGFEREDSTEFARIFPKAKWLNIMRRDKIGQAVSFWKAKETNQWRQTGSEESSEPKYNFAAIRKCYFEILAHDMLWQDFHEIAGTDVHHIIYEDFLGDVNGELANLLDFYAQHRLNNDPGKPQSALKQQRNDHSAIVHEAFLRDLYRTGS
jgi:LPS sulfotransferase NodH